MIDFSKYNLQEMQAVVEVLDWLTDDMSHMPDEMNFPVAFAYYGAARTYENMLVGQQARAAGEAPAHKNTEAYKAVVSEPVVPVMADPPAPPDMFSWVGDALDDLCAAGEVLGSNE